MNHIREEHFVFRIDIDSFSILDLTEYFHPFKIYGPTHIHYDFRPSSRDIHRRYISQTTTQNSEKIKMGYISLLCNRNDVMIIKKFPWFICFEKEIPPDK